MIFDVVIDDIFTSFYLEPDASKFINKSVLGLINDFEDGLWRFEKFQNFIWDNIAETSLSHRERSSLIGNPRTLLSASAKNLRLTDADKDISKGSELAEIVLYGIMKNHYNALPVVPKIFYKQNVQDNAKGADSVHIVITDSDFSIWFGEAKFYNNIDDDRLDKIISSVENSLRSDKLRKENSIITNITDIDSLISNEKLKNEIKLSLSNQTSIDYLKPKIHIPIFLLHECSITKKTTTLTKEYRESIVSYHKERATSYFKKQNKKLNNLHGYADVKFHLILLPVPEKTNIVDAFIKNVRHFKG
ncbi:DUF1837 domain-containing protein [Yersinia rochesterensis]|uniref:HamA C-terminal domain-containing protein n=1 Tax=Yersinia rochesterensis TaxID=1604335 RepID=UPI0025AABC1E|nr:DUF1837 domain-containing protein [Yersinia rochesterensis]MDN0107473.1 DUF1837 domain-containing protein [Yersinia rochesterensis]